MGHPVNHKGHDVWTRLKKEHDESTNQTTKARLLKRMERIALAEMSLKKSVTIHQDDPEEFDPASDPEPVYACGPYTQCDYASREEFTVAHDAWQARQPKKVEVETAPAPVVEQPVKLVEVKPEPVKIEKPAQPKTPEKPKGMTPTELWELYPRLSKAEKTTLFLREDFWTLCFPALPHRELRSLTTYVDLANPLSVLRAYDSSEPTRFRYDEQFTKAFQERRSNNRSIEDMQAQEMTKARREAMNGRSSDEIMAAQVKQDAIQQSITAEERLKREKIQLDSRIERDNPNIASIQTDYAAQVWAESLRTEPATAPTLPDAAPIPLWYDPVRNPHRG